MAQEAQIDVSHLHFWRRRKRALSEERIARLRALLPDVDDATWGAALAPVSCEQAEATP